jgi:hypothetical protein
MVPGLADGESGCNASRAGTVVRLFAMQNQAGVEAQWTVLVARFDERGMIPIVDGAGRRLLTDREDLRETIRSGVPVFSESGYRLTVADVDAGRLL